MNKTIAIEWKQAPRKGEIRVRNGVPKKLKIRKGKGESTGAAFTSSHKGPFRLEVCIGNALDGPGKESTLVTIQSANHSFSFFLRDVSREWPIFLPDDGVVVTEASDLRSWNQIEQTIRQQSGRTILQQLESEPEESFENAALHTRNLPCPTWLGLSRDIRLFEVGFRETQNPLDWIRPLLHAHGASLPGHKEAPLRYVHVCGRGYGVTSSLTRRLEEGILPILQASLADEGVSYHQTYFVTLETRPLTAKNVRGTHFLVADRHGSGHMLTPEQEAECQTLLEEELNQPEEPVLYVRTEVVNDGKVPRHAFFKCPEPQILGETPTFEGRHGFGVLGDGSVYAVCQLDGRPAPQKEFSFLLKPGGRAVFEFRLPHQPISRARAKRLASQSYLLRLGECRRFWKKKLDRAAKIHVPEKRLNEMVQAAQLHFDLVAFGREPQGTLAQAIGVYCPIGSESAPIIQANDSLGLHDLARRSLQYFLDKQHDDGFMQNFNNYMLENGAALWCLGEHYRYTRDDRWVRSILPKLLKSCEYLLAWRERNKRQDLRGKGYGLIEGKCADPEDPFRAFMLNGYACLGLSRASEMLKKTKPSESARLARQVAAWKQDIRRALAEAMGRSPVIPLADGTWCPTCPPWAEGIGPSCLFAEEEACFSHGTFTARDSLIGPLYLVFQEVLEPDEPAARILLNSHVELMHARNSAFSQPYYSPHPFLHLRRGEVKAFLKAFYNMVAAIADRETYSFSEHLYHVSPHKTHEEGWFLMQVRSMLYLEEGDTLRLLAGIPRAWMEEGKRIELRNVASYFGPISLRVESKLEQGKIEAWIECKSHRQPKTVELRIPHPRAAKAVRVVGGTYHAEGETVRIKPFRDTAKVTLTF